MLPTSEIVLSCVEIGFRDADNFGGVYDANNLANVMLRIRRAQLQACRTYDAVDCHNFTENDTIDSVSL